MRSYQPRTIARRVQTKTRSLAEKNQELAVLYETAAFLNEPDDIEDLCRGFLQRIKQSMGATAGAVRLYCNGSEELILLSHDGLSPDFVSNEASLSCGQCLCGKAVQKGVSLMVDTQRPPPGMTLKTCVREGFRTSTAFTISHKKQTLGVFNLYFDEPRQFSRQKISLLETLGQHLGMTVENQRLRARERELAVLEERNLIAQELHDSIAQGLAFLNIESQILEDALDRGLHGEARAAAAHIREGVRESYEDVRELLVHFRTQLHHSDLDSAILAVLEKFESQSGIRTEFDRIGSGAPLGPEKELQVLHIVQESLSNIRKHARASQVTVRLERTPDGVTVEVSDNGIGFDPAADQGLAPERHIGLKIMKERACRIGGKCQVTSAPGRGTTVTLMLPRLKKNH
ncbi:MAG TPA: ATP-binding protein [Rhodocyclaceae bacterium]